MLLCVCGIGDVRNVTRYVRLQRQMCRGDREWRLSGWEWNIVLTQEKTPLLSPEYMPLLPVDVMPGAQMRILFTKEPS